MRAVKFSASPGWSEILKQASAAIYAGNCFERAASLAFFFFLALFPALLFVVSLAGMLPVDDMIDRIVTVLSRVAPGDVVSIARQQLVQIARQPHRGALTLGLIATLWSTSTGITAVVDALNQAHQITESRSWWRVRLTAIALTVALSIATLIAFALVMLGPTLARHAADYLAFGRLFEWTWNVLRWPAAFALVAAALGCIYQFAPDTRHEWVWFTPGSVTATAIWLLISLAFKWYVSHFADYQKTYGAIGAVMIALLWFYFTGLAILIGAQLDATIEHASLGGDSVSTSWSTTP
jgi:membrane protein